MKLTLIGAKLSFAPLRNDPALLDDIEDLARRIADFLPHTPVNAIGINFLFEEQDNDRRLSWTSADGLDRLKTIGLVVDQMHRYSFSLENCILNLAIRQASVGSQVYDFNYHHQVATLADVKEIFGNKRISEYKKSSEGYIESIFSHEGVGGEEDV